MAGVLAADAPAVAAVVVVVGARCAVGRARLAAIVLVAAVPVGLLAAHGEAWHQQRLAVSPFAEGPVAGALTLRTDPLAGRFDAAARADWSDVPVLAVGDALVGFAAGDVLEVIGRARDDPGLHRGEPVRGRVVVTAAEWLGTEPAFVPANAIRDRIRTAVEAHPGGPGALVSGFLIGDTEGLSAHDRERLTGAGLSHFVAVSGSNVALFLGLWWVVTLPLSIHPRLRWATGLAGLGLFVIITRWEPSVLRAAAMAGLVLMGRALGVALSGWSALGLAVAALGVVDPSIVHEVGFQLSVAATLGLLAGAGMAEGAGPRWLMAPLGASVAAQAAVAPLLLIHFGAVPVVAPIANVLAAPLVAASTTVGGVGALVGSGFLVDIAAHLAAMVLGIARIAGGLPALGWWGSGVVALLVPAVASRRWRRLALGVGAVGLLVVAFTGRVPAGPSVVALDVGQGDAILLTGPDGARVLVDGGPDPRRLAGRLRAHGVDALDVVVLSHGHADHVTGLEAVWGAVEVGEVWAAPHAGDRVAEVLDAAKASGVAVRRPTPGARFRVGGMVLEVVGPVRRYASPNDGSLVVVATVGDVSVGLAGDIETWAQADLGPLDVDVLKVPHQGAATSDAAWLAASAGSVALISVGPNDYGHPSAWVVEVLRGAGAEVCRTDVHGEVVVSLRRPVHAGCG